LCCTGRPVELTCIGRTSLKAGRKSMTAERRPNLKLLVNVQRSSSSKKSPSRAEVAQSPPGTKESTLVWPLRRGAVDTGSEQSWTRLTEHDAGHTLLADHIVALE
jgi:hypothetical protein